MRNVPIIKALVQNFKTQFPNTSTNTKESMLWLNNTIRRSFQKIPVQTITMGAETTNLPLEGAIYFFAYNPKTKDKLPFYDMFPLTLILKVETDGFLALNFHYVHPFYRIMLFAELLELKNNPAYNNYTLILATLERLKLIANHAMFKPMIKKYLFSHMMSRLIIVEPELWGLAINLPVESFQKSNSMVVWNHSMQQSRPKTP